MSDIVINVENLWKEYRLGTISHHSMAMDLQSWWARLRGKEDPNSRIDSNRSHSTGHDSQKEDRFWALRDVSFEVKRGEMLGIVGCNGAGKSTLLKILSRVTTPTKGEITVKGRVASLLEVGTGFHPELTGRENVFLNGAILGMSKDEIQRKFDEIVAFAEIEKFIDTPVKRYSSGMYVRLAFGVAAHLEPEILIVDEVLAVGDAGFQKKCMGKMSEIENQGKTILLVSHNMSTILNMSTRCLLLSGGTVLKHGSPEEVLRLYQNDSLDKPLGQTDLSQAVHYGNGKARLTSITIKAIGKKGEPLPFPVTGCDLEFEIVIKAYSNFKSANVGLTLYDELGGRIVDPNLIVKGDSLSLKPGDISKVTFLLKNVLLKPNCYIAALWIGIANQEDIDGVRYATSFRMEAKQKDVVYTAPFPGVYMCEFKHDITFIN